MTAETVEWSKERVLRNIGQILATTFCSGENACFRSMCPGFDFRTRRHMRVEFDVGSLLCSERFFSGYSGFPLSSKTNILNSNSLLECMDIPERVLVNSLVLRGKTNYIQYTGGFI